MVTDMKTNMQPIKNLAHHHAHHHSTDLTAGVGCFKGLA